MNCKRVREVMFLVVDGEMGQELLISFREHLHRCPGCARQLDYTRRLVRLLGERCRRTRAPQELRQRIITSFPHRGASPEGPRE